MPSGPTLAFADRAALNCSSGIMGTWETALNVVICAAIGSWFFMALGVPLRQRR